MAHIFISYSHSDTDYAHGLAHHLQHMGFDVWIDARLDYGSMWPQEIQKRLDACSAFIVVMSSRSFESEWVQNELNRAKRLKKPIYPLLLDGNGPWLSVESTQFVDVRNGSFPDEKFYATLEQFVPRTAEQTSPQPFDKPAPVKMTVGTLRKSNRLIFAGAGVLVLIVLGTIYFIGRRPSSQISTPRPQPVASIPTDGIVTEANSPTETAIPPAESALPTEFMDAKGAVMVLVPEGGFRMGNDTYDDERPVHIVYLDSFYIDKYEVTNRLYSSCVAAGVCLPPKKSISSTRSSYYDNSKFGNFPVIYVDWNMAGTYCVWRDARLPTEAEWEKAARGSIEDEVDKRTYPWGEGVNDTYTNFNDHIGDTTEVGAYPYGKSPYNLFDMSGNVWEWVADWYSADYYAEVGDNASNPQGPFSGQYRVGRGGSWSSKETGVRVASRVGEDPQEAFNNFGFRCAKDAIP